MTAVPGSRTRRNDHGLSRWRVALVQTLSTEAVFNPPPPPTCSQFALPMPLFGIGSGGRDARVIRGSWPCNSQDRQA